MKEPHLDELYRSLCCPEESFTLYLCRSDFNPLALSGFEGYAVPSAFSVPLVHLLFKLKEDSGFARMNIETEVIKKGPKLLVSWESGTSRQGYLNTSELRALEQLTKRYVQNQLTKYMPYL